MSNKPEISAERYAKKNNAKVEVGDFYKTVQVGNTKHFWVKETGKYDGWDHGPVRADEFLTVLEKMLEVVEQEDQEEANKKVGRLVWLVILIVFFIYVLAQSK